MFFNFLKKDLVFILPEVNSKEDVINFLVEKINDKGYIDSKKEFLQGILDREKIGDTSWENGVAIPHFIGDVVKTSFISLLYIKGDGVKWSEENPPVNLIFLICMSKKQQGNEHLKAIAFIAKLFEDDAFQNALSGIVTADDIYYYIENVQRKAKEEDFRATKAEKIVAVTACPVGVAHTYIAAKKIENEAKKQGYDIRVETQGSIGIENALTEEEIRDAAIVILAVDKDVDEKRFEGKRVYKVSTVKAINNTENIIKEAFNAPVFFSKMLGLMVVLKARLQQVKGAFINI